MFRRYENKNKKEKALEFFGGGMACLRKIADFIIESW